MALRRSLPHLVGCLAVTLTSAGCGVYLSANRLVDADAAIQEARAQGARASATYELRLADRYFSKSLEHVGRSEYTTAIDLAESARKHARAAQSTATRGMGDVKLVNPEEPLRDAPVPDRAAPIPEEPPQPEEEAPTGPKDALDGEDFLHSPSSEVP